MSFRTYLHDLLRPGTAAHLRAEIAALARANEQSRLASKAARKECRRLERDIARVEARLAVEAKRHRDLRRRLFSPKVLSRLAAGRRLTFPPASLRGEGAQREAAFRKSAPAYEAAIRAAWPRPDVARIVTSGLVLWVPLDERQPDRLERTSRQDIPYHAVAKTREVGLGGIMLDIGANLGRTSLPRVLLGDVRAVYGAEADADNFLCLVHAVIDNGLRGFVLPDHVAIGAEDGTARLRRCRFIGGHRLHGGESPGDLELVDVPLRRLDTWVATHGIDPEAVSFVKVDVQGWECGVLRGAEQLLAGRRAAWQLEVDPRLLTLAGSSLQELIGCVAKHFTHFVDLSPLAQGNRHRPVAELAEALAYLPADGSLGTDILLYSLGE